MNPTIIIMTAVMLLTLFAPFGVYWGINKARNKDFNTHRKTQNIIFAICIIGLLALETLIRLKGGSGSLSSESAHYGTTYYKSILYSHITVAVLSYILWIIMIILSNKRFENSLPGKFSNIHKLFGKIIMIGLTYTAISALAVYLMTLNIV